ncbi:penicillin-binding protein [Alteribacter lacisalsi]|uniref:Penicillin-binding protein n=1 Tax=Alteribacter lacisalsi TaxID=2045244 RepID=A0A2W0HHY1_9BACI|nr:serine hydrolase domain-containing protein [Alteribacter lacisalsi]PYZ96409.1 penicillin-binding protein [Alteribacter lacisalsi]
MYKQFFLFIGAVMLLFLHFPSSGFALSDETDEFMYHAMETYHIPGASLAIVRDGELDYINTWGEMSDGRAVTPASSFIIGSISKPITSFGIMQLIDSGDLFLDEPVDTYLPSFEYASPNDQLITIRHLLEHTSGITAHQSFSITDQETFTGDSAIREAAGQLNGLELAAAPGETYDYASANYLLLGAVIEEVTGQPFADYMAEQIFTPLGMTQTSANYEEALNAGYVPGYESWLGQPVKSSGLYDHSGAPYGYMTASAEDLAKLLGFLVNGGDLLSDEMHEIYTSAPEEGGRYGFGWRFTNPFDDQHYAWHTGASPDYRSEIFFDPSQNSGAVLLINKNHQLEAEAYLSMMEGIRHIMNGDEPPTLPAVSYVTQWTIAAALLGSLVAGTVSLILIYRKIIINRTLWAVTGGLGMAIGAGLIPLFSLMLGTPWRTIRLFTPDVAFFVQGVTAVLVVWGVLTILILTVKRKKTAATKEMLSGDGTRLA